MKYDDVAKIIKAGLTCASIYATAKMIKNGVKLVKEVGEIYKDLASKISMDDIPRRKVMVEVEAREVKKENAKEA